MNRTPPQYQQIQFADFLADIFPYKVQKISINAGFSCPNRDGTKGTGGCSYCNNRAFSPQYAAASKSVTQQLEEGILFFARKYTDLKYIAYFQSYTNTYGDQDDLLRLYNEALAYPGVVGLIIGTRPDCMPESLLEELEKMAKKHFLLIEYGVESTDNNTLARINRGHTYEEAADTILRTHNRGIYTGAHIILGLPGEDRERILSHADRLSELPLTTIKLHQLQLIWGTKMGFEYEQSPEQFNLYTVEEYIDLCIDFIDRLNPQIIIDRFVSQSPKELLIAPAWGIKNNEFVMKLEKRRAERRSLSE